ncbi:hypothetical protein [Sphingobacterium sp. MYb382]|uniref:hypothetical protein n=1 Tax=Sphingobacterium sp. MYb382 TaxID=2745278 RepID=UPI0030B79444
MRKVKIIDSFCHGTMHEQFNASLLIMFSTIYPNITYYSGRGNRLNILNLVTDFSNVSFRNIWIIEGGGRFALAFRYLISTIYNCFFLIVSSPKDLLVFNYNNAFSLSMVNLINRIFKRKVLIFCHGEMELLIPSCSETGILHRLLQGRITSFFLNKKNVLCTNLYFFVTGDIILQNLMKVLPIQFHKNFLSLDHGYIFEKKVLEKKEREKRLVLGWVGVFNLIKGANLFCQLADKLDLLKNDDVCLKIVGKIFFDRKSLIKKGIQLFSSNGMLSRDEFNKRIENFDFIVFLYPINTYKFTASGAIMDAIDKRIPILALRNDYFSYIFEKYGEIGYLVDTLDELVGVIYSLKDDKAYLTASNFEEIQLLLSPKALSTTLREKLVEINCI